MPSMTLRQLVDENPEWLDRTLAVITTNGDLDYVGAAGMVFPMDVEEGEDKGLKVLVFSPN